MKYFTFYEDDSLRQLYFHESGELVGRKPLTLKLKQPRNTNRRQAISVRMGKTFIKRLAKMGIK